MSFIPFLSSWIFKGFFFRVLNRKNQGINLAKSMKYKLEWNLWIYLLSLRQYIDFTKIMTKYKDFKQCQIQPDHSFFSQPQ